MSNGVQTDKQQRRPDLFLMLHRWSEANVLLTFKKSKTWKMVVVGQGCSWIDEYLAGKIQATYIEEEKFLLPELIPFPWAAQWQNYMSNKATLQSFCQHNLPSTWVK